MSSLLFYVNGAKVVEKSSDPGINLLSYLRNQLRFTGSKLACGEGGCGACTVMVSKWDSRAGKVRHYSVNACLAPLVSVHECAVTTVEGIGSTRTKLHEVQERLARFHGSQCGFCTPGIVMSMYALLRNNPIPKQKDIETCLQGNLCRCTGYRPIISAFQTFACGMGDQCCKITKDRLVSVDEADEGGVRLWKPYDPSQEPIFPPELSVLGERKGQGESLTFVGESATWHQPVSLQEILKLKSQHPEARIVTGNTEIGIEMYIKGAPYSHLISPKNVPELLVLKADKTGVTVGTACSLSDIEEFLRKICKEKPAEETQIFTAIVDTLQLFGGVQIRNVASVGGNIMTASPISDLNPIFLASRAKLRFASLESGFREVEMDQNFFTGYRTTNTKPDEILISLTIPFLTVNDVMCVYKQSKRKEDDIAIVNAAMLVNFEPETSTIRNLSIAYGGMDAVSKIPKKTIFRAKGRAWSSSLLEDVCQWLSEEMKLAPNAPGGMVEYRRTLAISFFFKFYHQVHATLVQRGTVEENDVKLSRMIIENLAGEDESFTSTQTWQEVSSDQSVDDPIGRPVQHLAGFKHATGEAEYLDDILPFGGELHLAPVPSTRAHAKLLSVDTSKALLSPGVVDYVDVQDLKGENIVWGDDEHVFADGKVTCIGHIIGAIVADTLEHARRAARLVKVQYEDISPRIMTIEDAIEHNSFYESLKAVKGDIEHGFRDCDYTLNGEMRTGGQEHFYMETQSCIAIPRNGENEMEIWSSTQDPTELQRMASISLGIPRHKIVARTKRLGGGFGGKEIQFCKISNLTAVAARKLGKPVRCILTRQDDMQITGGRQPFLGRYKVGFSKEGRILALQMNLYCNSGNTTDLCAFVMHRAMLQVDGSYNVPNAEVLGFVCRTNVASNTAFRAFGAPQGTLFAEDWIIKIADFLKFDPEKIREINLLKDSDTLIYGRSAEGLLVRRCWNECLQRSHFTDAKKRINEFNKINRWKKRGIACMPAKYAIGIDKIHSQAGALVHIYTDGTVLLSHGGSEMGQGLHTKMIQVASRCLRISMDLIHTTETSTNTVPNASATSASLGSDLNGMAVKVACEKIMERLTPVKAEHPHLPWKELINKAYEERMSLSATGYYRTPSLDFDWNKETGRMIGDFASYKTSGAAVSEVEIDVLTGQHVVLRTELVMDVGNSMNPAVDIGQIEGAFAQGYGLVTIEEPLHSPSGQLLTVGPGAYKIPDLASTPRIFNTHLLRDSANDKAIYSSKAVGEPPLLLGISVFCAIREAIKSARGDAGLYGPFRLDSPATAERIRMTCEDRFTNLVKSNPKVKSKDDTRENLIPWSIRT